MTLVVESSDNGCWLLDGLQDQGFAVRLVNPVAIKLYEGIKYINDTHHGGAQVSSPHGC